MLTLTIASLRQQARRYVATIVAVVIGVAFVTASMTLTSSLKSSTRAALAGDLSHYAAVVLPSEGNPIPASAVQTVRHLPGVDSVVVHRTGFQTIALPSGPRGFEVTTPLSPTSAATVVDGRMATRAGEISLSRAAAAGAGLTVGDPVTLQGPGDASQAKARVVGIVDAAADPRYGATPVVFATDADVAAWTGQTGYDEVDVAGRPGTRADQLRGEVSAALGTTAVVRTGDEQAQRIMERVTGGTDFLGILLLSFAAVALFVSALVIGNTFAILIARRRRDTALLRCVGATGRQVRRLALAESVVVGLVGAVTGVAAGLGIAVLLAQLANRSAALGLPHLAVTLDPTAIVVPAVAGLVVTVLAASVPVWRTGRVAPLEALRPALPAVGRSRASVLRLALSVVLVAGGGALLFGGPALLDGGLGGLVVAMFGGVVSFLGVLLLASRYVPAVAGLLGRPAGRVAGPPGELAVDNAVRNPSRAAATSAALLVGVTLIAMMLVGGQTASASTAHEIDSHYPVDVMVSGSGPALPTAAIDHIERLGGVAVAGRLRQATANIALAQGSSGPGEGVPLVGLPIDAPQVLRDRSLVDLATPDTLLVDLQAAHATQVTTGERVVAKVGERHTTLSVRVVDGLPYPYLTSAATLQRLAPSATVAHLWLRLVDGVDVPHALDAVSAAASDVPGLSAAARRRSVPRSTTRSTSCSSS